ncbi:MAG TPA: hypothetical protein VGG01_12710 [Xanthobacteraceae bacterium]
MLRYGRASAGNTIRHFELLCPSRPMTAAIGLAAASVLAMAGLEAHPRDGMQVAAVFAPWTSSGGVIAHVAEADGLVVRRGLFDSIIVVRSDAPGLIGRLYGAGAWLVIDPDVFGGCLAGQADPAR